MKKIIKKTAFIFFILINILCMSTSANMTAEALIASQEFYDKHKFLIDSTQNIAILLSFTVFALIIIIPIIIIYKKIKHSPLIDRDKHIIKTLKFAELLFIFNLFIPSIINLVDWSGSKSLLFFNSFYILVTSINIGIILIKLLKKNKS